MSFNNRSRDEIQIVAVCWSQYFRLLLYYFSQYEQITSSKDGEMCSIHLLNNLNHLSWLIMRPSFYIPTVEWFKLVTGKMKETIKFLLAKTL